MVNLGRSNRAGACSTWRPEPTPLNTAAAWSRWIAVAAVSVAVGATVLAPSTSAPFAVAVAAVGFVAGVPHGAVDHLVSRRLVGKTPLAAVIAVYAGLAGATWALMRWAGPVAILSIVVLSAVHFGLGELEVARLLTGWQPGLFPAMAVVVAGCGALMLPLARSGDQLRTVASAISPDRARVIGATPVQIALVAAWWAAAAIAIGAALRARHGGVAVDIVLIGALGLLTPPLVAFAVWFGGWHALRHTARMIMLEPGCAELLAAGRPRSALARLTRLSALPSAAALTVVAVLVWFASVAHVSSAAIAEVLVVLLALTVPHMVVVVWLDRRARNSGTAPG